MDKESDDDGTGYNSAKLEELDKEESLVDAHVFDVALLQNLLEDLNVLVVQLEGKHNHHALGQGCS